VLAIPAPVNNAGQQGTMPAATCGNSTQQRLETCDDGNTLSGDGCSSSCAEFCGNFVVDDAGAEARDERKGRPRLGGLPSAPRFIAAGAQR